MGNRLGSKSIAELYEMFDSCNWFSGPNIKTDKFNSAKGFIACAAHGSNSRSAIADCFCKGSV